ncbi:hypothetical protein GYMLUDRAFT_229829 [Collybiopsis luxurians FD-317 M1]|uniref:F-box domain-containing protein n=1 Tax=Collybiopsis luxurians FD-317 M1 TaxID=944289 RepID=A0A0D0CG57_9AGAR|nr:hypothetical protein GYMLUDRAFT_229829 [Collybiopsis luxurians FD-317 M1]
MDPEALRPRKRSRKISSTSTTTASRNKRLRMPEHFRKVRGKFALLERLTWDIPLDVVFEIFCYLDPSDLLRLARTSKNLRNILMSKTSITVWRSSRENLPGLPPPPKDKNEPQYAQLLFENYCHVCEDTKDDCETIFWSLRMRVCDACVATAREALPLWSSEFKFQQPRRYRHREDILPTELISLPGHRIGYISSSRLASQLKKEYESLETKKERKEWILRKETEHQDLRRHSNLCKAWIKNMERARLDDILSQLEKIGWRDEAQKIVDGHHPERSPFLHHQLVKRPERLTDYAWNTMKPQLVNLLSQHKKSRLAIEKEEIVTSRYRSFERQYVRTLGGMDHRNPIPSIGDILTSPPVEDTIWETPIEDSITDEAIQKHITENLQDFIDTWRFEKIQELIEILRASGFASPPESDLHLAATVFECTECHRGMHYPRMFYHNCCLQIQSSNKLLDKRMQTFKNYAHPRIRGRWTPTKLIYSQAKSQTFRTVLESCSLDPSTATVQDLFSAHPLIECTTCEMNHGRYFMRWPRLLSHRTNHTFSINSFGAKTATILADEKEQNEQHILAEKVSCAHCNVRLVLSKLDHHLKRVHTIDTDKEGLKALLGHCYFDPRCSIQSMKRKFIFRVRPRRSG